MSTYRKGRSNDVPLEDGATIAVLGPLPEHMYDRAETGPMFRVCAVGGPYDGRHFQLFEDEIIKDGKSKRYQVDVFVSTVITVEVEADDVPAAQRAAVKQVAEDGSPDYGTALPLALFNLAGEDVVYTPADEGVIVLAGGDPEEEA